MKIGLFGGTFDPIHNGHIQIALFAYQFLHLDEVWFIINSIPPHKIRTSNSTNEDRLEMMKLALKDYPFFKICDIELQRDGISYTYDTVVALKEQAPSNEYYFFIGADNVEILHTWKNIDQLIQLVQFVAFKRVGSTIESSYPLITMDMDLINVSSTAVRNGSNENVNPLVLDYINRRGLYGNTRSSSID